MRIEPCPGCIDRENERTRARRAKDRRTGYDPIGKIEDAEFWDLLRWYSGCPCCGRAWAAVALIARDHIVPVSRNGPNEMKNIQPLCQECNLFKSDHIIYFDRHFPGRCAPLPPHLVTYLPPAVLYAPEQLSFVATATDTTLRFGRATARQLEAVTLALTATEQI